MNINRQTGVLGGITLCALFFFLNSKEAYAQQIIQDAMINNQKIDSLSIHEFLQNTSDTLKFDVYGRAKGRNLPIDQIGTSILEIYFRSYIREQLNPDYELETLFQASYGGLGDESMRYRYQLVIAKLCEEFWAIHQKYYSFGNVFLPKKQVFEDIVQHYSWQDLRMFAESKGINRTEVDYRLGHGDYGLLSPGNSELTKYGFTYTPYNVVYDYLISKKIGIRSSLKGANENGGSMHRYRTGLELKTTTFLNFKKLIELFEKDMNSCEGYIIVTGSKEGGHGKNSAISNNKATFGKPLVNDDTYLKYKSHELGNCVDCAIWGERGIVFLNRLIIHSKESSGRKPNKKMMFVYDGFSFDWMYHGELPLGSHAHMRF